MYSQEQKEHRFYVTCIAISGCIADSYEKIPWVFKVFPVFHVGINPVYKYRWEIVSLIHIFPRQKISKLMSPKFSSHLVHWIANTFSKQIWKDILEFLHEPT